MAVNATPEYEKAEDRYRAATEPAEQLEALQVMLRLIPKHKASEKLQADLKRKISTLHKQLNTAVHRPATHVDPYHIVPSGAGQVVLAGLPNTGKSSIVAAVTTASVKVIDYPFATTTPAPGMWHWQDAQLELVDTPPLTAEHVEGGLVNLLRLTGVVAVVADQTSPDSLDQVQIVLELLAARQLELADLTAAEIAAQGRVAKPGLIVLTHAPAMDEAELAAFVELLGVKLKVCPVDCPTQAGFPELAAHLWRLLNVMRVYTKRPGQKSDGTAPFALPVGATVADLARAIHRDLPERFKFARVWGEGRHAGQQVSRADMLHDKDVVEIHE
jgi:uncharacterized protein